MGYELDAAGVDRLKDNFENRVGAVEQPVRGRSYDRYPRHCRGGRSGGFDSIRSASPVTDVRVPEVYESGIVDGREKAREFGKRTGEKRA